MALIILIFIALFSILVVSRIVTSQDFNATTIQSLDDKKVTVMKLASTAAASSTVLSLIPGDAATPIANQIAELASYFIFILGAILLEKILIAVVGYVSFTFIIPFSCFLGIFYLYIKKEVLRNLAIKLAIFGIILFAAIPISIQISDLIYESYQTSIEQTVETAEQNKEYIEEKKEDISEKDQNWIEKIEDYLSDLTSKIGIDISAMVKKGEDTLTAYLDVIAILIITSCVIPIIIILIFAWIIKILFSFDINGGVKQNHNFVNIPQGKVTNYEQSE
jgi:FtsZ-binding cell division protein ZapB